MITVQIEQYSFPSLHHEIDNGCLMKLLLKASGCPLASLLELHINYCTAAPALRNSLKQTAWQPAVWHISILIRRLVPQSLPSDPGWLHLPDRSVLLHTSFPCRHQTLITPRPCPANWLARLGHTGTPLLESFQCPSWRLLGSSLPGAPAPCLPDWVPGQANGDWTWHGDRKQGRRAREIKEQRWQSEADRDGERGRWVCSPGPLWPWWAYQHGWALAKSCMSQWWRGWITHIRASSDWKISIFRPNPIGHGQISFNIALPPCLCVSPASVCLTAEDVCHLHCWTSIGHIHFHIPFPLPLALTVKIMMD